MSASLLTKLLSVGAMGAVIGAAVVATAAPEFNTRGDRFKPLTYAELTSDNHRFNTSILVDRAGRIVGKYRKVHLPGHAEYDPQRSFQHLEKRYF